MGFEIFSSRKDYNAMSLRDDKRRENEKGWLNVTARSDGSREQQVVVDTKERSTDVKSWGNKKVALILAGRTNKGP